MPHTIRIQGENVRMHSMYAIVFATEETIALCGLVGKVERMRIFDELTGEMVTSRRSDVEYDDPELWFRDLRSNEIAGPVRRSQISMIYPVDCLWQTPEEVEAFNDRPGPNGTTMPEPCEVPMPEFPELRKCLASLERIGEEGLHVSLINELRDLFRIID